MSAGALRSTSSRSSRTTSRRSSLSLIGKAREQGLLDLRVHDLRDFTHDRHRTVDDTPYGGGAGHGHAPRAVGRGAGPRAGRGATRGPRRRTAPDRARRRPGGRSPRRWRASCAARAVAGLRLRALRGHRRAGATTTRAEPDAGRATCRLGDYVLNGGEVAVLAIVEAVGTAAARRHRQRRVAWSRSARGRACSSTPSTPSRRPGAGCDVPEVLLSGHHGRIARWRRDERAAPYGRCAGRTCSAALDPARLDAARPEVLEQVAARISARAPRCGRLTRSRRPRRPRAPATGGRSNDDRPVATLIHRH